MKNLFLAHTEYHFLLAMQIIAAFHGEAKENIIVFTTSGNRKFSLREGVSGNVTLTFLPSDFNLADIQKFIDKYENFYYFQNGNIKNRWLTWKLKEKEAKIHLVQDGMAAYCVNEVGWKKPLLIARDTIQDYKTLKRYNFPFKRFFITNKFSYGYNAATDDLYLTDTQKFNAHKRGIYKKLISIPPAIGSKSSDIWNFLPKVNYQFEEKTILILNQHLWSEQLYKADLQFVSAIAEKFKDYQIYIKFHPLTEDIHRKEYENIEGLNILNTTVPAELLMHSLKNSIIISGYSTALLVDSTVDTGNRFYYYYPIFTATGDKAMRRKQIIVFDHIKVVSSINDIS